MDVQATQGREPTDSGRWAAVSGLARYTAPAYGLLGSLGVAAWAALRLPPGRRPRRAAVVLAGLAPLFGSCAPAPLPVPETPNVLLLVVDTLRADHLGPYDPSATFTPNVDRFAERGVVFRNAIAQAPNTIGSAPSILGSIYVSEHGYRNYGLAVSNGHLMLAEVLREGGYETFGVAANPHVAARNGLAQGFDTFIDNPGWSDSDAHELDALFFDWLGRRTRPETPFFALLWYIEPHVPYDPPVEWLERHVAEADRELVSDRTMWPARQPVSEAEQRVSRALYRAEVAYFDHQLGQLVAELDRRGLAEGSLIILTADHGESFWERTDIEGRPIVGHGKSLFREELAVPLIVKLPGDRHAGTAVLGRADSIDIAPTVLEVAGYFPGKARARFRGRSLLGGPGGPVGEREDRPSFSELWTAMDDGAVQSYMESVEAGEGKLVRTHVLRKRRYRPPAAELLEPGRERPLPADADLAVRLERELRAWRSALQPLEPGPAKLRGKRRELVRRLRALGYVD